jgi:chromosome segregation and condensation protein ScpB
MRALPFLMLPMLAACVEEPTSKDAEKAVEAIEQDDVKERQLSIEEAAEEATKLIEAEAKEEIDELATEPAPN